MKTIGEIIDRLEQLSESIQTLDSAVDGFMDLNADVVLSLNKDQLLLGRNTDGNELTPSYLNDPYFKSPDAAKRYADMKKKLEGEHRSRRVHNFLNYPEKSTNTPNLIVRGNFQDAMFIRVANGSFTIDSGYDESQDIESKYNNKVFGLSPESKRYLWDYYMLPVVKKHLKL